LSATVEDLLTFAPLLTQVIPELTPSVGFIQHSPHHRYDVFTHIAHVVAAVPAELSLRWAALLHDIGKPAAFTLDENGRGHFKGHAKISAEMADAILLRLKAPSALRQQVTELIGLHMTPLEPDKKLLRRRLGKLGQELLEQLLMLQEADMGSKGTGVQEEMEQFPLIRAVLAEVLAEDACFSIKDLAINGWDLQQAGFAPGPDIGKCLGWLLGQVQDEVLPNERQALLQTAKNLLEERE
jgi:tRNA nucleotidyltransferase (CCA-adding enzyme)